MITLTTAVLLLGFAVSSSIAARSEEPGRGQLLLVPDTDRAQRVLERSDAEVVASYEAFDLVLAHGDDVRRLKDAGADRREDMRRVQLAGGDVDPAEDGEELEPDEQPARGLALVQFVGPVKQKWLRRLRDDVRVVAYVPENAYVVAGRRRQLERLAERASDDAVIRAVTEYRPEDKLAEGADEARILAIQTLAGDQGRAARRRARELGRPVRSEQPGGPFRTVFIRASDEDAAEDLAEDPGVVTVGPYDPPELRDERASQIAAGNLSGGQPVLGAGYLSWLSARGFNTSATLPFAIDVTDEGMDNGKLTARHPDLHRQGLASAPSRVSYLNNYTSDDGKRQHRDCGGHGTINASIAAGYNVGANSLDKPYEDTADFNYGLGVAPQALVGSSKIFRCKGGTFSLRGSFAALASAAYAKGARISNNSWSSKSDGAYTSDSRAYDALVRDSQPTVPGNQEIVEVFSAGNVGSYPGGVGSPASGKNVIAVGASEGVRPSGTDGCGTPDGEADDARDIASFSARGPTDDGRLKPDLVGPGTHITGAAPQHGAYDGNGVCNRYFPSGNTLYSLSTGTSHSAPVVAGAAALVRDHYTRTRGTAPSSAMTKAVLINTATDVAGRNNGTGAPTASAPNNDQGWGLVNLARALQDSNRAFVDQSTLFSETGGEPFARTYEVADSSQPVEVTLVWTDAPGTPNTSASYVNNLNLEVVRSGLTYKGNVFSGGVSVPGAFNADFRNNVESVVLTGGTSGSFDVRVIAANLAGDGVPGVGDGTDQDFALVVSNVNPS